MKTRITLVPVLAAIAIILCGVGLRKVFSQPSAVVVDQIDREILKRTEAQLQALQLRYQSEAGPIVMEHDEIVKKYCSKAGLVYSPTGNCAIDVASGLVTKKSAQVPPK